MEGILDHRRVALFVLGSIALASLGSLLEETFLLRVECVSLKLMGKARNKACSQILQDLVTVKHKNGKDRMTILPLNHTQQVHQLRNQAWEEMLDNASGVIPLEEATPAPVAKTEPRRPPKGIEYGGVRAADLLAPAQAGFRMPSFGADALLAGEASDEEKAREGAEPEPDGGDSTNGGAERAETAEAFETP